MTLHAEPRAVRLPSITEVLAARNHPNRIPLEQLPATPPQQAASAEVPDTSVEEAPVQLYRRPLPRPVPPASLPSRPSDGGTGWAVAWERPAPDQLLQSLVQALNDVAAARRHQARVLVEQRIGSPELRMASVQLDAELIRLRAYVEVLSALEDLA
ncbi:MAG TPA: hypothetical protein VGL26_01680 [Jatrophihabitans sp.]|jgi:hypothetical protein